MDLKALLETLRALYHDPLDDEIAALPRQRPGRISGSARDLLDALSQWPHARLPEVALDALQALLTTSGHAALWTRQLKDLGYILTDVVLTDPLDPDGDVDRGDARSRALPFRRDLAAQIPLTEQALICAIEFARGTLEARGEEAARLVKRALGSRGLYLSTDELSVSVTSNADEGEATEDLQSWFRDWFLRDGRPEHLEIICVVTPPAMETRRVVLHEDTAIELIFDLRIAREGDGVVIGPVQLQDWDVDNYVEEVTEDDVGFYYD